MEKSVWSLDVDIDGLPSTTVDAFRDSIADLCAKIEALPDQAEQQDAVLLLGFIQQMASEIAHAFTHVPESIKPQLITTLHAQIDMALAILEASGQVE